MQSTYLTSLVYPAPKPTRENAPRVRKPAALRHAPRPPPAPSTPTRLPAAVVRTDKPGICHSHLVSHFGLGGPCSRPACVLSHIVADYSKAELLASVARQTRGARGFAQLLRCRALLFTLSASWFCRRLHSRAPRWRWLVGSRSFCAAAPALCLSCRRLGSLDAFTAVRLGGAD